MVLYKGYCRPLGKKVDFTVEDVISMNTKRGIKWRVKGKFEDYNISTFCSAEKAQELLSKLPLKMDAEIAYTPPPTTYEAEELIPYFSNTSKPSEPPIITYEAEELVPYTIKKSKAEDALVVHEQIQENTNAQELELQSEKLPAKYYKKDGSLDMRYTVCREFAAKQEESQNAVELEAPYTPLEPERPSDDYGGGGRHRKKPRRPLGAESFDDETEILISDIEGSSDEVLVEIGKYFNIYNDDLDELEDKVIEAIQNSPSSTIMQLNIILEEIFTPYIDNSSAEQKLMRINKDDMEKYDNLKQGKTVIVKNKIDGQSYEVRRSPNDSGAEIVKRIDAESFEAEDMITITGIDWETDGEDVDLPTTMDVPAELEEDEIADYLSDQKGWLVNGFVMGAESFDAEEKCDECNSKDISIRYKYICRECDYDSNSSKKEEQCEVCNSENINCLYDYVCNTCDSEESNISLDAESFGAEDMITVTEIDWETDGEDIDLPTTMDVPAELEEDEIADYLSDQKGWLVNGFVMGAESFEAAYTPEQRLDDYTPEQLTTSSAVTGDFFEDSLKYSYGGFQAENEELGETSYAEDVPALQRAEAGMEVEDIEQAYKKKEDQFMTLVVDDATLFRLAPELPAFVEMENTQLAGYTSLKFNFVENPEMEQKILSYAIDVVDDKDDKAEEPEFKEGDVRNRLFNVEFDDWAEQEMLTHGKDVSFKEWADEESESHGDGEFMDWAKHEDESHEDRYGAETDKCSNCNAPRKEYTEYKKCGDCGIVVCTPEGCGLIAQDSPWNNNWDWLCSSCYDKDIKLGTRSERHQYSIYDSEGFEFMAEWRNLSDFEMGDRDRYALGDEIIAISQTLKENKVDDWRAVKKLGKAIKQGKFTRVRDEMGNIGIYSRRAVWDKHHKDFFELFSDSQIQALGIPWVVNDYRAEITDEDLSELESKLDRKIDSYVKGLNYTQCVACDKEAKVEILEDKDGNAVYHFYSCECGHNDIQDSSYDAESANKYQLMAEEMGGLYQVLNNRGFKIEFDNGYELSVMIGAGTYSDNYDISPIGEMARGLESSTAEIAVIHNGLMLPLDETGGSTVIGYVPTSILPSLLEAVSKGDDDEIRKVVGQFKGGDFDAETFEAPADGIDSLRASMKEKKEKLKELNEELEQRKKDLKEKHDSDIAIYGKVLGDKKFTDRIKVTERKIEKHINSIDKLQEKINAKFKLGYREDFVLKKIRSNDPTANTTSESTYRFDHRYSGSARQRRLLRRRAEESFEAPMREIKKRKLCDTCHKQRLTPSASNDGITTCATCTRRGLSKRAESFEADGFIKRIPKSKSMEEKFEILKNNVKIIFEEAQRPLYPLEVMTLYEQKSKRGITQRNLTRIVNTQPDKYYVSRRGLIHYIGEGSMQDYIKNLDPQYFAEDDSKSYNYLPNEDDILKYLENSHRSIRKYNAPYRYSSKGMAEKFGVSQDAMRGRMGRMERAGKVKSTPRRCEDAPKQYMKSRLKIYYLPDKRLMGAENYPPSYMVDSDVDSLVDSSERLEDMVDERKEYPEWWKSQLSVSSDKVDGLADFLEYAERNDKV